MENKYEKRVEVSCEEIVEVVEDSFEEIVEDSFEDEDSVTSIFQEKHEVAIKDFDLNNFLDEEEAFEEKDEVVNKDFDLNKLPDEEEACEEKKLVKDMFKNYLPKFI